jgi:fused signal recognition particle receptor
MAFSFFKKKNNTTPGTEVIEENKPELIQETIPEEVKDKTVHELSSQEENVPKETLVENLSILVPEPAKTSATPAKLSWAQRLKSGLSKTRDNFSKKLVGVFGGGRIDENLYEELETILLSSDIGVSATRELLEKIRNKVRLKDLKDGAQLKLALQESIEELLLPIEKPLQVDGHKPFVIMLVGVNGAGKTTSIGKLAKYYQDQGKSILLAAGDTFRAAAREQLMEWGKRNNVTVISQESGDSAAVCFDAIKSAAANKIDIVIADTAGRLPTQLNLMEEIKKVKRVIGRALDGAPHEILLVLDSNIGQNALNQVKAFDDALKLSGLILTKLDGTAKGGIICAIARERPIPLRFIGVGETIDDLRPFNAAEYAKALFE